MSDYKPDVRPQPLVKANVGKASGVAAAAVAVMVGFAAAHEGEVRHTYRDPVGIATYCYGETHNAIWGRTYTHQECLDALSASAMTHATDVQRCLPQNLPVQTAAAFYDFGYNAGAATFCKSSMSRKALAGDLRGACASIKLYVYAGGRDCRVKASNCRGVVTRRDDEYELCMKGLS